jgi:hypothetical protein
MANIDGMIAKKNVSLEHLNVELNDMFEEWSRGKLPTSIGATFGVRQGYSVSWMHKKILHKPETAPSYEGEDEILEAWTCNLQKMAKRWSKCPKLKIEL